MAKVQITCPQCGETALKESGAVNRSRKVKAPIYCGISCAGLARRLNRSGAEKRRLKAEYDRRRLEQNREEINAKKRKAWRESYDPIEAAKYRKSRMHIHVEYCRRPEYRKKKKAYDRQYQAKKQYGEFGDCFLLLKDLQAEIFRHQTKREIDLELGRIGKSTKRKRDYARTHSNKPETGPLGDAG